VPQCPIAGDANVLGTKTFIVLFWRNGRTNAADGQRENIKPSPTLVRSRRHEDSYTMNKRERN